MNSPAEDTETSAAPLTAPSTETTDPALPVQSGVELLASPPASAPEVDPTPQEPASPGATAGGESKACEQLAAFLRGSAKLADAVSSLRKDDKELAHNAARSLFHALNEWWMLSEGLQRKPSPKIVDGSEQQLVHYWRAAAVAVGQFDPERASQCEAVADALAHAPALPRLELRKLSPRLAEARKRFETLLSPRLWVTGQTGRSVPTTQE